MSTATTEPEITPEGSGFTARHHAPGCDWERWHASMSYLRARLDDHKKT